MDFSKSSLYNVVVFIIALIACLGAFLWLLQALGKNPLEKITNDKAKKGLYISIGVCGLLLLITKVMFVVNYGFRYSCAPM